MATSIGVTCPLCEHKVNLGPAAITVVPDEMIYSFVCPTCGEFVTKDADDKIVQMLIDADVRVHAPHYPEEIADPSLPRITLDDVIDFGLELEGRST
jgi:hypothetical protein